MAVEPAHIAALLSALTQPDTNTIRQAEAQLKPLLKQSANMMPLWAIISDANQPEGVRHVGAIVLRKRLPAHYQNEYNKELQMQWQHHVLNLLAQEKVRPVRAGLVGVAAALAQVEQQASEPFLQFLSAAANETNPDARELCFLLLQEMTETIGMHWKEHMNNLLQLFTAVLHSTTESTAVHKAAVQAVGQLMSFWADEPEIDALAPLLPVLLNVASRHWNDEDFLATVLDVLYDLAYSPAPSLAAHMEVTLQFALQCLRNRELELRVRDAAALVIATTAEAKPKTLGRNEGLIAAILDTLFQMMQDSKESAAGALFESNPAWKQDLIEDGNDDFDDDDDPDAPTETSMAQGTLDMLACEIPKKYIWQPALTRCLERMRSSDANARKAGVAGLGVIAEGCAEPLTGALQHVLPSALQAARDPAAPVRECACFCLGQISEHCQPDILQYNSEILPIVFGLLDDQSVAVQATSCYVLEMFCERLEPHAVRPLLDPLVRKLAAMLEATNKRSVQEMAVAALAATAVAAEDEFSPYVTGVATIMAKLMILSDESQFSLRGRALECMGHMAIAVGRDNFRPYFTATMQSAMHGLTLDSTDLQEFAYAVFANLAKVMKDDFAPALPELVPHLVEVIDMDEGQLEQASPSDGGFANLDDSDDEEENGNYVLHVRTALLEVKKGAITALGEMAAHTGSPFCPHLESCMQVLQKAAGNWHPIIKGEVADAFPSMIVPSIAAYHNGEIQWKKGDLHSNNTLSQHTSALVQAVLTEELALMNDEDKMTVGKACEAVQNVIELCGPQALMPVLNELLANTHRLLTRQAPCQTADEMYGETPDDDDDHDVFMQAACDLIGAMGRVMGNHFGQFLPQFLPAICEYAKVSRPPSDRSMAVGCLSELCQELDQPIGEHWKSVFLPVILQGLSDEDHNVRRNAAFCAGVACENLKEAVAGDYQAILQKLGPNFSLDTSSGVEATSACVDNSAAAVARMIMASPQHVPLGDVLPAFVRVLPLKVDMTENETIYKCLLGILSHPEGTKIKAEIGRIFQEAIADGSKVEPEMKNTIKQALQSM